MNRLKTVYKKITICSSAYFYKDVIVIKKRLEDRGYKVLVPSTALKMAKSGNFAVAPHKRWLKEPKFYQQKRKLIEDHFHKIEQSDAILVVNNTKNGQACYIGGNVLMEMTLAFYLGKQIYILNDLPENAPFKEELHALSCKFLHSKLKNLKFRD